MKKLILPLLALTMLASCGHQETADESAAFTVTADAIVAEFLDNAEAANAKYNDQIIEVTGPVMELSKENGMITAIKLSSDEFNIVNATFQHPIEADQVPSSGELTVKGVCSGFLGDSESMLPGGTVELKRSALVK
jgi:hypothetical protein